MSVKVAIPNSFATATSAIPLSQLDNNFNVISTAMNSAITYSNYAIDTGSVNNYIVTLSGIDTTYAAGLRIQFLAANTNTSNCSLNVNGQGAKAIVTNTGSDLNSQIIIAGSVVDVIYDGVKFQLLNITVQPIKVTTITTSATITPNVDTTNQYEITALATPATIQAPTGTPYDGLKLIFRIKDNGSSRALTWDAIYRVIGVTLPTTTVSNKVLYVGCIYNSQDSTFDVLGVNQQV